jgi:glucosamine--fructose-6-phosphate aminotransferase (isomerizing)
MEIKNMCGIVGYMGTQKAEPILLNGLYKLEYRGYDSAGIATIENNKIVNIKNKGRVADLAVATGIDALEGTMGIAHTRWATHGKPSAVNSHPHQDNSKHFAVVHNGIIENYAELRKFLTDNRYTFLSDTDTEVIPNLVHYYFNNDTKNDEFKFLRAVKDACSKLKGSYAIEIISDFYPDEMIVVRKDSPLVIGKGLDGCYISSDIPAILSYTKDFYLLNDNEFTIVKRNDIVFYDTNLNKINKAPINITWDALAAEKDGYPDFMLKEIHEQPRAIRETIGSHLPDDGKCQMDELQFTKEYLSGIQKIYLVACGTAMHAGLVAKTMFENICEITTEVDIASEFRYRNPLINNKTLCIFISQSGETADTIAALKLAKNKGAKTIAISNVGGSSITREADYTIYTHAGPEIAVASTKAYTSQIALLSVIAIYFAETLEKNIDKSNDLKAELKSLAEKIEETFKCADTVNSFAQKVYKEKDIFFLGRGVDYAASMEGSLKLKEISYIHSEAYASGELKHGPIALIEDGITVISIVTVPELVEKSISNIQEVVTRGAKILMITNQDLMGHNFDEVIKIPKTNTYISPILSIIPLQLFAYYISKEKGLDVDKPRNLAKSVTVE